MSARRPDARTRPDRVRFAKAAFYRQCRMLHTYLSAFAFLALIFFSATGLLLNHPDWLAGSRPAASDSRVTVAPADLAAAMQAAAPAEALAAAVGRLARLRGLYRSGEIVGDEAMIRLEGPTGTSDLVVDLTDGSAEVTVQPATLTAMLNDLHRGKHAGTAWSALIDASAILMLGLSVLGFVLFFTIRPRLASSLKLTVAGLVAMVAVFYLCVP